LENTKWGIFKIIIGEWGGCGSAEGGGGDVVYYYNYDLKQLVFSLG